MFQLLVNLQLPTNAKLNKRSSPYQSSHLHSFSSVVMVFMAVVPAGSSGNCWL